ncbi:MAG: peptidoglycan DD-metalloendopeptidase family protein [Bacteroidales bacterium]|nr:peptidoglycan DD-metalloendopeptidase family protein [Bacteroidales bacterium]
MTRFQLISCILMLAFFGMAGSAYAQTEEIEAQKKKVEKLEADISFLDSQIASVKKQQSSTLEELVLIRSKIAGRKSLIAELDRQIIRHNNAIAASQQQIKVLEQRLDTLEMHYRNMVYNAYKHRDSRLWFMYILASDNMEQGYRRWSYLKNYSKAINGQAEKIRGLKEELDAQIKEVKKLRSSAIAAQASRTKEYKSLTAEEKQSQAFAKSLDSKQSQYRKELAKKRQEADRLARQVERMIAQEIEKEQKRAREQKRTDSLRAANAAQQQQTATENQASHPKEAPAPASAETVQLSGSFALNKGKLPFPVASGVIVEKFGEHPHPTLKNVKLPFNNGINISTKPGSNVKAVFDGVVKQVIAIPGYNQCILVQHGNYFTFYCKLTTVVVKVGDKVSTGTFLGALDPMGSTATLHFELWNGTTKQNPELWLKK